MTDKIYFKFHLCYGQAMDTLSQAWITDLETDNDVSRATIAARKSVLRSVGNAGTATREEIEAWWKTRAELARSTRNANLSHLRAFYTWCSIWEHRADDPSIRIKAPRTEKGLPRPLGKTEIRVLMKDLPDVMRRAAALITFGGIRVSEAAALDWDEVDWEARRMRITGKGRKTRIVGIGPELYDEIAPAGVGRVIGEEFTADRLQRKLNRAIAKCGVKGTTHQLRHRFGTVAVARTHDINAVAHVMGHSSPATTAIYAQMGDEMIDIIANAVGL